MLPKATNLFFMGLFNIEIKARTSRVSYIRQYLLTHGTAFIGTDLQTDTYFNVPHGRLKLREGNIENNLIFYDRNDLAGPKQSAFNLVSVDQPVLLKEILGNALGHKIIVQKTREIYFINNVKFHLDQVDGLGEFVEIEASNKFADLTVEVLKDQCTFYMQAFEIQENDLINCSYSDM